VGFAALNTGNNLLYLVFSFLLGFLVLSGVFSEAALRGIEVRRRLPREVFAEHAAPVALEVSNRQRRVPSFAVVVEELAGDDLDLARPIGRVFVLRVAPAGSECRCYGLVAPERGELRLAGFRVSTRFPFGLFSKSLLLERPERLLVYPAVERLAASPALGGGRLLGASLAGTSPSAAEVSGLREFVPGDALGRVHWRASLRRGSLLVREREREAAAELEVRLRTRGRAADAAFEEAVRHAASEVVAHLEAGCRVGLVTDSQRIDLGNGPLHRAALLSFLARVQPDEGDLRDEGGDARGAEAA
jgi:uncharacterized protein (DUF58 family)